MKVTILTSCLLAFLFTFSTQTFAVDFTVNLTADQHDASAADGVCDIDLVTAGLQCSLRAAVEQANNLSSDERILFNLSVNSIITSTTANGGEIYIAPYQMQGIMSAVRSGTLEIIGIGANNLTISGGGTNRIFYADNANLTISGVTLTAGSGTSVRSKYGGGAIIASGGSLTLDSVHVKDNSTFSAKAEASGGGFCNHWGGIIMRSVTITNNSARDIGGIDHYADSFNFGNTIVAGNIATSGFSPEISYGGAYGITSAGGNLVGDSPGDSTNTGGTAITYQPTDIRDADPMLGALQNNGGTTPTHALLVGSPAIDAGLNALAVDPFNGNATLAFDQRRTGFPRQLGAAVDIGAFERRSGSSSRSTLFDFDGDGKADISVFRPSNGFWYIMKSSGGYSSVQWGLATDRLVPGDYDGDGKTDLAVYRSGTFGTSFNNTWYILRSSDNTSRARQWGISGGFIFDAPVPADYDGDGKTDLAFYRNSDAIPTPGHFQILQSSTDSGVIKQWGTNADKTVPADYDGDGKADLAVFRTNNFPGSTEVNTWYILQSSNGAMRIERFGLPTDRLVPADYDGDGKADIAVWRPSNGFWYRINSSDGSFSAVQFGITEDKPVPADYDGDGKTDIAVFRPSTGVWYLQRSTEGFSAQQFGLSNDIPIPNVYVR
ncbi:MAG: FG-GAP-like repeat-containing protein [Acidobacteria bacterium]|nr:FG-GAP-like repeat-containing protein [Acidobacteriota bacterium]